MDRLANMKAFRWVAQTGSFAESGRQLGIATSVVSKRVKDLEEYLGTRLIHRTTRKLNLTESGYYYLEQCQRILDELEEIEEGIRFQSQKPVGEIKLAAPLSFGVRALGPLISSFLNLYPEVSVKTYLSDRKIDLVDEGYDLAIRIGKLNDSSLISKKIMSCQRLVCASPDYLAQHGLPTHPNQLMNHHCLSYSNVAEGKSWPFVIDNKTVFQPVQSRFYSDNGDLLCQAALAGCGLTMLPSFIIDKEVEKKNLQIVLQEFVEPNFSVYIIYQSRRHLSNKVRLLIDHLTEGFGKK